MMETILLALCGILAFRAPGFATTENLLTVLRSISMQGLIAFGMTLVIIVGEIDLSVGAVAAFAGCLLAWLTRHHLPIPIGSTAVVLAGAVVGVSRAPCGGGSAVPSFITTLALLTGLRGLALMITGGFPLTTFPPWFYSVAWGDLAGIPFPTLVLIAGFVTIHLLSSQTAFGRAMYATGSNPLAARLSGIDVARVRTACLAITGALAALSGVMLAAQIMSGTPMVAQGWELDVIAAVIIGGTSLSGGAGTVWGTLVGIVLIGVIGNGMTLLDVPVYDQYIVRGVLIFAAVLLNRLQVRPMRFRVSTRCLQAGAHPRRRGRRPRRHFREPWTRRTAAGKVAKNDRHVRPPALALQPSVLRPHLDDRRLARLRGWAQAPRLQHHPDLADAGDPARSAYPQRPGQPGEDWPGH